MSDEDKPTPPYGFEAQRTRTPANGVPRRSRAMPAVDPDEIDSQDEPPVTSVLDARIDSRLAVAIKRRLRWLWRLVSTALIAAGGAVFAVLGRMLDGRESDGHEKARIHYLEQELMLLRARIDRLPSSLPWRRDEQPDLPTAASPRVPAAPPQKDPSP